MQQDTAPAVPGEAAPFGRAVRTNRHLTPALRKSYAALVPRSAPRLTGLLRNGALARLEHEALELARDLELDELVEPTEGRPGDHHHRQLALLGRGDDPGTLRLVVG